VATSLYPAERRPPGLFRRREAPHRSADQLGHTVCDGRCGGHVRCLGEALGPSWPGLYGGGLDKAGSDLRCVSRGLQLVFEQGRVELASVIAIAGDFGQRLADTHQHPTLDLAGSANRVDDRSRVMASADRKDTDNASFAVQFDPHGVTPANAAMLTLAPGVPVTDA